jgi:nitric oxide reductase large subunit
MYFVGLLIIAVLNAFFYIDQTKNNKDLYLKNRGAFNAVISLMVLVEVLFFSIVYLAVQQLFGI